jgi:hypothetical protein
MTGCGTVPTPQRQEKTAEPKLQFVDLGGFDQNLANSLSAPLPSVDVVLLDRIAPSAIPMRLQTWMAAVESGGGTVTVVPPPADSQAKSPMLIIGLITSLWSASKMAAELAQKQQFAAAKQYDAQILLKRDSNDNTVVDKLVFVKRGSR